MHPEEPERPDAARAAREADEDLAALTRVLLGRADALEDPVTTAPDRAPETAQGAPVEDVHEERRLAAQRQQRLLEELSFLDE